jgi:glucokinase
VIVGLDVRHDSLVAVRLNERGEVIGRAMQEGATAADAADVVRDISGGTPKQIGAAVRDLADPEVADLVAAAAGAARVTAAPRILTTGAAIALGEQWAGAAQGAGVVVALSVTDRVDAGIVLNGQPYEGAHGLAGAAAWLSLNPVERDDYRRAGGLGAEVAEGGIVQRLIWRLKSGSTSRVLDLADGRISTITLNHILDAARQGDGIAIAVIRDTSRYIGMAVSNLVATVDPDVVVLSGLPAEAPDLLVDPARAEAERRVPPQLAGTLRVVAGTLGEDAAALGAARAAMIER